MKTKVLDQIINKDDFNINNIPIGVFRILMFLIKFNRKSGKWPTYRTITNLTGMKYGLCVSRVRILKILKIVDVVNNKKSRVTVKIINNKKSKILMDHTIGIPKITSDVIKYDLRISGLRQRNNNKYSRSKVLKYMIAFHKETSRWPRSSTICEMYMSDLNKGLDMQNIRQLLWRLSNKDRVVEKIWNGKNNNNVRWKVSDMKKAEEIILLTETSLAS